MANKIFISGSAYSGKSSLIYLFEGHSEILANVLHFKIIDSLNEINNTFNWIDHSKKEDSNELAFFFKKDKSITKISKKDYQKLFNRIYDFLKDHAIKKQYPNLITSFQDTWLEFNFDYENFEKKIIDQLFKHGNSITISYEDYIDIFYYNFFSNWKDINFINSQDYFNKKYLVNKLPNNVESIEFILNETKDSKIIFVERDLIGIMKSRVLEHIKQRNLNIKEFDRIFYSISKSEFFDKAISYSNKVKKLKTKYNNRIYITDLNNLVYETEEEMKKISNFCQINYEEIISKKTHLSKNIENQTNEINDDKYPISKKCEFFVNLMIWNKSYIKTTKKIYFFKYYKEILLSIYLKLKFLFKNFF